MSPTSAVIFDLDDTLHSEREYAFSGFEAVAVAFENSFGDPTAAAADMRRLFDTEHRPRVFDALLAERGRPEDPAFVALMVEAYRTHHPVINLFPDADAALSRLCLRCKLGLITDGPKVQQWAKIDALGLGHRFDEIIVTSELGENEGGRRGMDLNAYPAGFGKPHPRAFELMSGRLGVGSTRCAYVADNPAKDFVAPNALGWRTVQIVRAGGIYVDRSPPDGGSPHHTIDSLDALDVFLPTGNS